MHKHTTKVKNTQLARYLLLGLVAAVSLFIYAEIALQIFSFYLHEKYADKKIVTNKEFVILALGESTTALGPNPWPLQLEAMLRERFPSYNIRVVNKAIIGTNTSVLVHNLRAQIEQYKPKIIIAMMGINDLYLTSRKDTLLIPQLAMLSGKKELWIENIKTIRFLRLLGIYGHRFVRQLYDLYISTNVQELKNQAIAEQNSGNFSIAEKYFIRSIKLSPTDTSIPIALSLLYEGQHRIEEAKSILLSSLSKYPADVSLYTQLGKLYSLYDSFEKSEEMYLLALERNPKSAATYVEYGNLIRWRSDIVDKGEAQFRKAYEVDSTYTEALFALANLYLDTNRGVEAAKLYEKILLIDTKNMRAKVYLDSIYNATSIEHHDDQAKQLDQAVVDEFYHPITQTNYQRLIDLAQIYGINVVAMEYPNRSALPLQKLIAKSIGSSRFTMKVVVVENVKSFQAFLKDHTYNEVFTDHISGNFGHATAFGNMLIAENAANGVADILSGPKDPTYK